MGKEKITFEQMLSSIMVLYSNNINDYDLDQIIKDFLTKYNDNNDKYELVFEPLRYLSHFVEERGEYFRFKEGFEFNTDISKTIQWTRPCTLEEYLVIVAGREVFNDMYELILEAKEDEVIAESEEQKVSAELFEDPYFKRLSKFYGGK